MKRILEIEDDIRMLEEEKKNVGNFKFPYDPETTVKLTWTFIDKEIRKDFDINKQHYIPYEFIGTFLYINNKIFLKLDEPCIVRSNGWQGKIYERSLTFIRITNTSFDDGTFDNKEISFNGLCDILLHDDNDDDIKRRITGDYSFHTTKNVLILSVEKYNFNKRKYGDRE